MNQLNKKNLNKVFIPLTSGKRYVLQDYKTESEEITVYFRDLATPLLQHIRGAEAVVGAVAWLCHPAILNELTSKEMVSIIIAGKDITTSLKKQYKRLPQFEWDIMNEGFLSNIRDENFRPVERWEAIRCIKPENVKIKSMMHHKFLLFCRLEGWGIYPWEISPDCPRCMEDEYIVDGVKLVPHAVWTGSFNLTNNATNSLENALYITTPEIVQAYYQEWCQLIAISEPLRCGNKRIAPQWKLEDKVNQT